MGAQAGEQVWIRWRLPLRLRVDRGGSGVEFIEKPPLEFHLSALWVARSSGCEYHGLIAKHSSPVINS